MRSGLGVGTACRRHITSIGGSLHHRARRLCRHQLGGLTSTQVRGLTATQLNGMGSHPAQRPQPLRSHHCPDFGHQCHRRWQPVVHTVQGLASVQIAALSTTALSALASTDVQAWTTTQAGALTTRSSRPDDHNTCQFLRHPARRTHHHAGAGFSNTQLNSCDDAAERPLGPEPERHADQGPDHNNPRALSTTQAQS